MSSAILNEVVGNDFSTEKGIASLVLTHGTKVLIALPAIVILSPLLPVFGLMHLLAWLERRANR